MPKGQGTEVTHRNTGDSRLEIGTPSKGGKITVSFSDEEIHDFASGRGKIDQLMRLRDYTVRQLKKDVSTPTES